VIVCSCNILSCHDIRKGVDTLLSDDLHAVLTPGKIYAALGKRMKCGGCMPNTIGVIHQHAEKVRAENCCSETCSVCFSHRSTVEETTVVEEAA